MFQQFTYVSVDEPRCLVAGTFTAAWHDRCREIRASQRRLTDGRCAVKNKRELLMHLTTTVDKPVCLSYLYNDSIIVFPRLLVPCGSKTMVTCKKLQLLQNCLDRGYSA